MSLPKGYKKLEYIQSSGTQFVDTGFKPNNNTRVTADFEITESTVDWACVFGAREESLSRCFALFTNSNQPFYCNIGGRTDTHTFTTISPLGRHVADANKNAITINGISAVLTARTFQNTATTIYLCANNEDGAASMFCKMRIYSCQIYDNGTLVRDYVPAMLSSGEVGLYDRVFHGFYRNAGTGEFTAGPEASKTPNAPSTFQLDSVSDTSIVVSWHTVADALGYKLWLNGSLLADTTETTVIVTVEPFTCMVLSLVAYNENGNSSVVTLTHQYAPDNPILWLVTDRTTQDVALGNTKGTYNASDLNRVGYAVSYLADKLASCGVATTVHPKTDWLTTDIPSEQVLVTYLQNVRTLRTALTLVASVPEVPQDMQFFTHTEANSIEMLLVMLDTHITNMLSNVDTSWAVGSTYTGLYAKEAYR